jgi:transcriptional regulator with XRE-family HTH domain
MLAKQHDLPHSQFAQRLHAILLSAGCSTDPKWIRDELLKANPKLRISQLAVNHWLTGHTIPRAHNIKALADWLNVPPCLLAFGQDYTIALAAKVGKLDVTLEATRVLEGFLSLKPQHRHDVAEVIKALSYLQAAERPNDLLPI